MSMTLILLIILISLISWRIALSIIEMRHVGCPLVLNMILITSNVAGMLIIDMSIFETRQRAIAKVEESLVVREFERRLGGSACTLAGAVARELLLRPLIKT
jgi:UPF0716 family protein affecting phage T7 exclusion